MLKHLQKLNRLRYYYAQAFTRAGEYELRIMRDLVPKNCLAIDIGANSGIYSFHMSRFASSVLAFEPNPEYHDKLRSIGKKVQLQTFALSDVYEKTILRIPKTAWGAGHGLGTLEQVEGEISQEVTVEAKTLDQLDLSPGFIKIDVEGHEMRVIRGATATLLRSRPNVLVECEERHNVNATRDLNKTMEGLGYNGGFFHNRKFSDIANFDPLVFQDETKLVLDSSVPRQDMDYVNNFIFIPAERSEDTFGKWR